MYVCVYIYIYIYIYTQTLYPRGAPRRKNGARHVADSCVNVCLFSAIGNRLATFYFNVELDNWQYLFVCSLTFQGVFCFISTHISLFQHSYFNACINIRNILQALLSFIEENRRAVGPEGRRALQVPKSPFARHLWLSVLFLRLEGLCAGHPEFVGPQPQEQLLRPAGVRHLFKWSI